MTSINAIRLFLNQQANENTNKIIQNYSNQKVTKITKLTKNLKNNND